MLQLNLARPCADPLPPSSTNVLVELVHRARVTCGLLVSGRMLRTRHDSEDEWEELRMEVHELGHVVLTVSDLAKSVHFYGDVLGFRPVREGERSVMFSSGRTHHELLLVQAGPDAGPLP